MGHVLYSILNATIGVDRDRCSGAIDRIQQHLIPMSNESLIDLCEKCAYDGFEMVIERALGWRLGEEDALVDYGEILLFVYSQAQKILRSRGVSYREIEGPHLSRRLEFNRFK